MGANTYINPLPFRQFAKVLLALHTAIVLKPARDRVLRHGILELSGCGHRRSCGLLSMVNDGAQENTSELRKLKVLCLHGYRMNGGILRDKSGGFRKPFKKNRFEMVYLDGPFACTNDEESSDTVDANLTQRAWWRAGDKAYLGWKESMKILCDVWDCEQFDGILGFSQGAAAAAMLCTERRPKFGIFVSGFIPRDAEAAAMLLPGLQGIRSVHVYGLSDNIVPPEKSRELAALFSGARLAEHDGGHMLPSGRKVRPHMVDFVECLLNDFGSGDAALGT